MFSSSNVAPLILTLSLSTTFRPEMIYFVLYDSYYLPYTNSYLTPSDDSFSYTQATATTEQDLMSLFSFATATTMDTDTNLQLVVTLTKLPMPPTPVTPACAAGYTPVNSKGVCDDSTAVPALCYDGNYAANAAHCTTGPSGPLLSCSSQVYPISGTCTSFPSTNVLTLCLDYDADMPTATAVCVAPPTAQPPSPPPSPPSQVLPSPTGTMTWNGLKFDYAIDTGSYIASSLTLVIFASDNTVLGTYAAKPTSTVTQRTATALPVVAKLFAYAKVSATVVGPPKQRSNFVLLTLVTTHIPAASTTILSGRT